MFRTLPCGHLSSTDACQHPRCTHALFVALEAYLTDAASR